MGSVLSDEINGTTRRSSLHKTRSIMKHVWMRSASFRLSFDMTHSFHNLQLHRVHQHIVNVELDAIITERPAILRPR
jgi:hypothetical protein